MGGAKFTDFCRFCLTNGQNINIQLTSICICIWFRHFYLSNPAPLRSRYSSAEKANNGRSIESMYIQHIREAELPIGHNLGGRRTYSATLSPLLRRAATAFRRNNFFVTLFKDQGQGFFLLFAGGRRLGELLYFR